MIGMALLSLPAYMADTATESDFWHRVATALDVVILVAFSIELVLMMAVSSHPIRYLLENWLNVVIIAGSAAAVFGSATEWIPLVRMMRVALGGMVLMRTFTEFNVLLTRRGPPLLLGATLLTMMGAGALFYWLDPRSRATGTACGSRSSPAPRSATATSCPRSARPGSSPSSWSSPA